LGTSAGRIAVISIVLVVVVAAALAPLAVPRTRDAASFAAPAPVMDVGDPAIRRLVFERSNDHYSHFGSAWLGEQCDGRGFGPTHHPEAYVLSVRPWPPSTGERVYLMRFGDEGGEFFLDEAPRDPVPGWTPRYAKPRPLSAADVAAIRATLHKHDYFGLPRTYEHGVCDIDSYMLESCQGERYYAVESGCEVHPPLGQIARELEKLMRTRAGWPVPMGRTQSIW
jgi:hypothetical protein